MRYLGGKYRLRKKIAAIIESYRTPGQPYLEPFVGSCAVFQEVSCPKIGTDIKYDLIMMHKALQRGWIPPENISKNLYYMAKANQHKLSPQLRAFISIGCSYGGKVWGGYAQGAGRNTCAEARRKLLKHVDQIRCGTFFCIPYDMIHPTDMIIYCDPPYQGTTGYRILFDHDKFWNTMRHWSKNNTVIISEYSAPEDFRCIQEFGHFTSLETTNAQPRMEKLWALR